MSVISQVIWSRCLVENNAHRVLQWWTYMPVRVKAQQINCMKRVYSRSSEDDLQEACDCQAKSVITDINQNVLN